MRIFDAMGQQVRQRQGILGATWARNRRQRLICFISPRGLGTPRINATRVSDVGGGSREVFWRGRNPSIDGFRGKRVINDQLFACVWQVWHVAFNIKGNAAMLWVLYGGALRAIPCKLPPTLGAKFTHRQHRRA
jgi:hypothetical protein